MIRESVVAVLPKLYVACPTMNQHKRRLGFCISDIVVANFIALKFHPFVRRFLALRKNDDDGSRNSQKYKDNTLNPHIHLSPSKIPLLRLHKTYIPYCSEILFSQTSFRIFP